MNSKRNKTLSTKTNSTSTGTKYTSTVPKTTTSTTNTSINNKKSKSSPTQETKVSPLKHKKTVTSNKVPLASNTQKSIKILSKKDHQDFSEDVSNPLNLISNHVKTGQTDENNNDDKDDYKNVVENIKKNSDGVNGDKINAKNKKSYNDDEINDSDNDDNDDFKDCKLNSFNGRDFDEDHKNLRKYGNLENKFENKFEGNEDDVYDDYINNEEESYEDGVDNDDEENQRDIPRDLVDLVKSDDIDSLKEGLEQLGDQGMADNCVECDARGLSAFTLAGELDRMEAVRLMVGASADVNVPNKIGGWTALHCACSQGHVDMVTLLLRSGADVEVGDNEGWTPLHFAASNGCFEIVQLLMTAGSDVSKLTAAEGYSPLYLACQEGHVSLLELLLRIPANLRTIDKDGWSPLHCASQNEREEVVERLLKYVKESEGEDAAVRLVGEKTLQGVVSLYLAAQNGFEGIAKLLIPYSKDSDLFENEGSAPIHVASQNGHLEVVRELISASPGIVNLRSKSEAGWGTIHFATQEDHVEVLRLLISSGAEVESVTLEEHTALHIAAEAGSIDCMGLLLKSCKDPLNFVLLRDHLGWNAFHYAVQNGNVDAIQIILNHFEDGKLYGKCVELNGNVDELDGEKCLNGIVCSRTTQGESCLLIAVMNKQLDVAKLILEKQKDQDTDEIGDVNRKNNDSAKKTLNDDNDDKRDDNDNNELLALWTLQAAVENDDTDILELLVESGIDLNIKDENGWNIVSFIAEKGQTRCLEIVLKDDRSGMKMNSDDGNIRENPIKSVTEVDESKDSQQGKKPLDKEIKSNKESDSLNAAQKRLSSETSNLEQFTPSPQLPEPYSGQPFDQKLTTTTQNKKRKRRNGTINLNSQNEEGQTALFISSHKGYEEVVVRLLEAGARTDIVDYMGWSPLHAASEKGFTRIVELLLNHFPGTPSVTSATSANSNSAQPFTNTWIKSTSTSSTTFLDANKRTYHGFTPLYLATQSGRIDTVKYLLTNALADPNVGENQGFCPVHVASQHGFIECLEALFEAGALGNRSDSSGWTPLHFALQENRIDVASLLINQGLDVDAQTGDGIQPLLMAVSKKSPQLIAILLQQGASTDIYDPASGQTPLLIACKQNHLEAVKLLVDSGADVESGGRYDESKPLYLAIKYSARNEGPTDDIVNCLLNEGASPVVSGGPGSLSGLHLSAQKNLPAVVRSLVINGAPVDSVDEAGWTSLMFACRYGHVDVARTLLELGAKTDLEPLSCEDAATERVSSLILATQSGHIGVVELLLLWSCGIDATTGDGKTALYCAAQYGDFDMVQILLYNGADPNVKDKFGFIALHPACFKGHRRVVESLVKAGSEVDERAKDGLRPVQLANTNGHEEIVEWLVTSEGAKPPDYEQNNGWGFQVISYIKNLVVNAFKHGIDEYSKLHSNEEDFDNIEVVGSLKRQATIERAKVKGRISEDATTNFYRASNVRQSISRPAKKVIKL